MGQPVNVAFTLRTDGRRDYIERTVQSISDHIKKPFFFSHGVIIDDSGDVSYADWLDTTFPELECLHHPERLGLGGCFKSALDMVLGTDADYAFLVEDDTPLIGDIDLTAMAAVLDTHTLLAQLMLMRPPFNTEEIAAGGVYALTPNDFTECSDGKVTWTEHSRWYGFQPHLVKRNVIEYIVSNATNFLELDVTDALKPAGYNFGYWGGLNDPPLCEHVGTIRSQNYRW